MNVSSFSELLHLHGYGLYVWPAYAVMLAALLAEPWLIRRRMARARQAAREASRLIQISKVGAAALSQPQQYKDPL